MRTEIETLSPTKISLTIELDVPHVKEEREKVFQGMVKDVQLKGFRKGKAPRKMVEKMINQEALHKELLNRLVGQAYDKALKENKIRPITVPNIDVLQFKEGEPFKFKATFERRPDINLPHYKRCEVGVSKREIKEEEIENVLKTLKEQRATYEDLQDGVVEEGRGALVDLHGFVDGKALEGAAWQGILLHMQKDWPVIPGLMEKMFGMKSGDERDIQVTLPPNFDPQAGGKEARFKVHVHGVKERKVPEVNDQFAQLVNNEFKTVEDLKVAIRKQIQSFHEHEEKNEGLKQVLEQWSQTVDFPVPEVYIEEKLKQFEREILKTLQQQGKTFNEFLKEKHPEVFLIEGTKEEEKVNRAVSKFREDLHPDAVKQAKIDLILDEISVLENLKITQEEVNSEIGRVAEAFKMPPDTVAKALQDKNMFQEFIGGMLRAKASLLVRENLVLTYGKR